MLITSIQKNFIDVHSLYIVMSSIKRFLFMFIIYVYTHIFTSLPIFHSSFSFPRQICFHLISFVCVHVCVCIYVGKILDSEMREKIWIFV